MDIRRSGNFEKSSVKIWSWKMEKDYLILMLTKEDNWINIYADLKIGGIIVLRRYFSI
jgi:hypothetical protein